MSKNPFVYLNFVLNKLPDVDHKKMRKIEILHPIYSDEYNSEFLFIVSNEFKKANKEILSEFKPRWRFVKYDKIKKNFTEYKDKRNLLKSFDAFFCERKISLLMKNILGKNFFEMKKFPYPISFEDCVDQDNNLNKEKLS